MGQRAGGDEIDARRGDFGDAGESHVAARFKLRAVRRHANRLGLKPDDPAPIDLSLLPQSIRVYDTIYKKTPIVRECERRGIPFANGLAMLLHQGARSLELWTGRPAPVEIMRAALNKAYAEKQ